ncbi:hypothetical protein D3C85_925360 [compost metagenome]
MIDAEHPRLVEYRTDRRVDRLRRRQRVADRFLQHDARVGSGQAGDLQVRGDLLEQVGRGGQVVDPHALTGGAQVLAQAAEIGALAGVHGEIVEARGEALPGVVVEVGARHLGATAAFGEGLVGGAAVLAARQGEDAHVGMQPTDAVQVVERRQQLVQGQIARAAKHQHVTGNAQSGNSDSV